MLLDYLVTGGVLRHNTSATAATVKGTRHSVRRGKTPVLRIGAAVSMKVFDVFVKGNRKYI